MKLSEQEIIRRQKIKYLEQMNVAPFGFKYNISDRSTKIIKKYENFSKDELASMSVEVSVAGRIMTIRGKGKAGFAHIKDSLGLIQLYIRKDVVGDSVFSLWEKADIGDIIGVKGLVMKTKTNEVSIRITNYTHLVKALRPLPEKFHGLQDVEERYRRRYVDLIVNDKVKDIFIKRSLILHHMREYLNNKGFLEVDTPVLHPTLGGASARPFITHHNQLNMPFYLRIAVELYLKRLIVGGLDKVYEIARTFRNEGVSYKHNPEFTMLELYQAYADMKDMMNLTENMIVYIAKKIIGTLSISYNDTEIDLNKKFARAHMVDLVKDATNINFWDPIDLKTAIKYANDHNIEIKKHYKVGHIINEFFEKYIEHTLIQPTFVYGHPIEISPLAKTSKDNRFTERFELFINGREYANAFSELNDPIEQKSRFENQLLEKEQGNDEANEMDIDFIESLEYGMPPTGGLGLGIDRLVMLLTDQPSIRDVLLFPHMKNKK